MNNNEGQFKEFLGSFINSYAEREESESFSGWLENKLRQEIPELSEEASKKLTEEIFDGIANYNNTLKEVNAAAENGVSKDEWLAEKLEEAYSNMPLDQAGKTLLQIEKSCLDSNNELLRELDPSQTEVYIDEEPTEWNKFNLKKKAYDIGKQIALTGTAAATNVLKNKVQDEENTIGEVIQDTFENGLINDPDEVKAVVAGAVMVASEKGLKTVLPAETDAETICDLAGAAVECSQAIFDAANGNCSGTDVLERTGRAAVAAGCNIWKRTLEGYVLSIPYVGSAVRFLLDGLFEHMGTAHFQNNVYTVVKDAAVATWEGLKNNVRKIGKKIKNALFV